MTPAILFDDGLDTLSTLTDLRPSFAVRTGALTTRERLVRSLNLSLVALLVPEHLQEMARSREGEPPINALPDTPEHLLLINGRCPLAYPEITRLEPGNCLLEAQSGDLIAGLLTAAQIRSFLAGEALNAKHAVTLAAPALLARPWHVRTFRDAAIDADLALLHRDLGPSSAPSSNDSLTFGLHPLTIHPKARIYPGVVLDRENGPIVIDEGAILRPACTLIGPAYIGPHSTILDRALIKAHTAIGPHCKIAGEVGGTIFHGFANKAHDGHLGDSWIGKWANLGAGTTNSNLLNTYAEVMMRAAPDAPIEKTGQQFMGCIIGDHVKTAICTRIMTGAILGTGAMYAATIAASGSIPPFAWCTDEGRRKFRIDKFIDIARTVMARRKHNPGEAYLARLTHLHASTSSHE